ncbi:MAG: DnaA ATPase domain-containing protein [Desulfohalobiaceae bacterium]
MHGKSQEESLQQSRPMGTEYFRDKIQELLPCKHEGPPSNNWLNTLVFELDKDSGSLSIYFPHLFLAQWFEQNLKFRLKTNIAHDFDYIQEIHCKTHSSSNPFNIFSNFKTDDNYSFENYIYNDNNYLAYNSAYELAYSNNIKSNPFLLIGKTGVGKTHLLKAIANAIANKRKQKILFTNVQEINNKIKNNFHSKKYITQYVSEFDFLLIDDIEYLDYYTYLQPELISIFDHFFEQKKQMVFACTGRISSKEFFLAKLQSRLASGLLIPVHPPDLESRMQYLQVQAQEKQLNLGQEQLLYLAMRYLNFKSLYRIIIHLLSQTSLHGLDPGSLDMEEFRKALPDDMQTTDIELNNQKIIALVAEYFQISTEQILSGQQDKNTVLARQIAMYLCRSLLQQTYTQIGQVLGGKDHSTVLYSCQKIKKLQKDNKNIKNLLKTLEQKCQKHFIQR